MTVVIVAGIAAAATHYLYGGLRVQGGAGRTTTAARVHLSVILGGLPGACSAGNYWLERYELATKNSTLITGLTYADAHAVLPAKAILAAASVICAALFFATIWTGSWRLPGVGVALLLVCAIVIGLIYPALVQSLKVRPSAQTLERPYISRNITATRTAYDLTGVAEHGVQRADGRLPPVSCATTPKPSRASGWSTRRGCRTRSASSSRSGSTTRSPTPSTSTATRSTASRTTPSSRSASSTWAASATPSATGSTTTPSTPTASAWSRPTATSAPATASRCSSRGTSRRPARSTITQPRVYFGEQSPDYSIVGAPAGTGPASWTSPDDSASGQQNNTYAGKGGVKIGSFFRKLLYAIKYKDENFLLSNAINNSSQILYDRDPRERVEKVAPWLTLDGDPYPAVVDGHISGSSTATPRRRTTRTRAPRCCRTRPRTR